MAIDRKSSIRKAPLADVVDVLTSGTETKSPVDQTPATAPSESVTRRGPGPGRPRSKRRMEPFSSKIEIGLRDDLDAYLEASEMTIIDFLDEAIRDRLKK